MDPLTNQQVNTLGAQGYREGDNVPGKGTLLPDGTYSQTQQQDVPVQFPQEKPVADTYVNKNPTAQYDANGQFTGYKNYDGSFTNPDGSLKGDTSTDTSTEPVQTDQEKARNDNLNAMATAQKQFSDAISGWRLSTDEQAQVDDLKQQYDQMIADQKLTNTSASGTANIRGYQTGAAEYDPTFQAKTIGSIVTAGANKIKALQVEEAGKVAQLTRAFKDDDIKNIKIAYDSLKDIQDKRADTIQKTIDEANTKIKEANTAKQKVTDGIIDIAKSAKENGASKEIIDAINSSTTVSEAIANSGDYLQKATGELGDYLFYKREKQASGLSPLSYDDWKIKQDAKKATEAYNTAYSTAKGKAAAEADIAKLYGTGGTSVQSLIDNAASFDTSVAGREKTSQELSRLAASGKWGDLLTRVQNQAKKGLPADVRSEVTKAQTNIKAAKRMADVLQQYSDAGGSTGFFKGTSDDIATKMGQLVTDPKFKAIATELKLAFQQYRQDMTGAAFGAAESRDYKTVVPSPDKKLDLNLAVINGLTNYLSGKVDDTMDTVLGSDYQTIKDKANPVETVNNYVLAHPEKAEDVAKLYDLPGWEDSDVLDYINSLNK